MTAARRRVSLAALAILVAAIVAALAWSDRETPIAKGARDRPTLLLLTSLPLVFGEQFSIEESGSPVLEALERDYEVRPIATASADELSQGRLLLMAHPLAQPAETLVELDAWVRSGGRVLLLADPMLEWPDSRPLGDPTRPPPMFMDTGLLAHWGLTLSAPDERGEREATVDGRPVLARSPGTLSGDCAIGDEGLVARCTVGKGRAVVIADADFLDWRNGRNGRDGAAALLAALASLRRP